MHSPGQRGAYRLTRPIEAIEVPATVQVILAARIDRLPTDDKQLLQTASVIGKDVPFVLLQAVADVPEDALRRGLAHLQAAEFLYETGLVPDLSTPSSTRSPTRSPTAACSRTGARPPRPIVDAIERLYPDRLAEHVERLAHHAVRGELWEKAVALSPAGRRQGLRALGQPGGGCVLRAGADRAEHLPETRERQSRPSTSLRPGKRSFRSEITNGSTVVSAKPKPWRGRSTINGDSGSCRSICAVITHSVVATSPSAHVRAEDRGHCETLSDVPLQVAAQYYRAFVCHTSATIEGPTRLPKTDAVATGNPIRERFGLSALPAMWSRAYRARALAERGMSTRETIRTRAVRNAKQSITS